MGVSSVREAGVNRGEEVIEIRQHEETQRWVSGVFGGNEWSGVKDSGRTVWPSDDGCFPTFAENWFLKQVTQSECENRCGAAGGL